MAQPPKGGLVRGYDKPIHGSCAIYFPGGIDPIKKGGFPASYVSENQRVLLGGSSQLGLRG